MPSGQLLSVEDACAGVEKGKIRDIVRKQRITDFNQKVFIKWLRLE
ncbi:MAG: hypothetical protein AAGJ08_02705 [Cyanobacteria bacterium P01_H01_bin.35]